MASSLQDEAQILLSKYCFNIDTLSTKDDLTCILCKKLLTDAYQTHCGCQYCRTCIINHLSNGKKHCLGNNDECKDEYLILDKNVNKSSMLNKKILKVKLICPNESCSYSTELSKMEEHLRICTKESIECPFIPIGCDNGKVMKDTLVTHLHNETLPHSVLLMEIIDQMRNEIGALKVNFETEIHGIKESCNSKENRIADLEGKSIYQENQIAVLEQELENQKNNNRSRVDPLLSSHDTIDSNESRKFDLTIEKFKSKMKVNQSVFSPYFYSHSNGYKLQMQIRPRGEHDAEGTHLTAYIHICKGEYDARLSWPCKYIFEIGIVNQRTGSTHNSWIFSYDTVPDQFKNIFESGTDKGYGETEVISHQNLLSNKDLLFGDCVVVRCTVRRPR